MKKILLTLCLCLPVNTQIFGWRITFDQTAHNKTYEILTFEKESDYQGMIKQMSLGSSFIGFLGVMAPVAGKLGEYKVGQLKKIDSTKASDTTIVLASDLGPQKYERTYSEAEIELIMITLKLAATGFSKLVESGALGGFFTKTTKKGYTVDYIKSFRPGAGINSTCRDAESLAKHIIHPIKSNEEIFFVILDKKTSTPLYADWGSAYGKFNFRLVELQAQKSREIITVGDMEKTSQTDGKYCEAKTEEPEAFIEYKPETQEPLAVEYKEEPIIEEVK